MSDEDIRTAAHIEMAEAIIGSLEGLCTAVILLPSIREQMAPHPEAFINFVITVIRKRHLDGLTTAEIKAGIVSS